jgi:hypothetical protein
MQQQEAARQAASKIVPLFDGVLLTESERAEAFWQIYAQVLEAVEWYHFRMSQEAARLKPIPAKEVQ